MSVQIHHRRSGQIPVEIVSPRKYFHTECLSWKLLMWMNTVRHFWKAVWSHDRSRPWHLCVCVCASGRENPPSTLRFEPTVRTGGAEKRGGQMECSHVHLGRGKPLENTGKGKALSNQFGRRLINLFVSIKASQSDFFHYKWSQSVTAWQRRCWAVVH